jgi:hypothetical protein
MITHIEFDVGTSDPTNFTISFRNGHITSRMAVSSVAFSAKAVYDAAGT